MSQHGSVTIWIAKLKDGESDEATRQLWNKYFGRLVGQARNHLRSRPRGLADEEDLALSAFDSFVRATERGKFPRLDDRDDLWQVLLMLTSRKAIDLAAHEQTQKRGEGKLVHFSALQPSADAEFDAATSEPGPAEAVALAEGLEVMLGLLGDPVLSRIAVLAMEGNKNTEIAAALGISLAGVERKLKIIRTIYTEAGLTGSPQE